MPRVQFIPFDPERFAVRSNGSDHAANGGTYDHDGLQEGHAVRRQAPHHPTVGNASAAPYSELQAVMEARPHDEPELSVEEQLDERELAADAVATLDERERYLIEALFYEDMSLRELGKRMSLSKTHVARLRDECLAKMRTYLLWGAGGAPTACDETSGA